MRLPDAQITFSNPSQKNRDRPPSSVILYSPHSGNSWGPCVDFFIAASTHHPLKATPGTVASGANNCSNNGCTIPTFAAPRASAAGFQQGHGGFPQCRQQLRRRYSSRSPSRSRCAHNQRSPRFPAHCPTRTTAYRARAANTDGGGVFRVSDQGDLRCVDTSFGRQRVQTRDRPVPRRLLAAQRNPRTRCVRLAALSPSSRSRLLLESP